MAHKMTPAAKRRLWKRHKVNKQATVLVKKTRLIEIGKPLLIELGPLVDISMGGLAVQYIESKERAFESEELAIAVAGEGLKVEPLPFKICLELELAVMPDGKRIKKRCVEFVDLTAYQTFQLKSFIQSYTQENQVDRRSGADRRQYNDPRFDDEDYRMIYERRAGGDRRAST